MSFNVMGIVEAYSGRLVERYEYTPYGERKVYAHDWLYEDVTGDGYVNPSDLAKITLDWLKAEGWYQSDINVDGVVNSTDLSLYTIASQSGFQANYSDADPWVSYPLLRSNRMTAIETPAVPHHSLSLCDFGHQGLMHDEATGLIYNRARMRHPELGRFMQRDPLGYVDGMDLYAAYHVMWGGTDPSGTIGEERSNTGKYLIDSKPEKVNYGLSSLYDLTHGGDDVWRLKLTCYCEQRVCDYDLVTSIKWVTANDNRMFGGPVSLPVISATWVYDPDDSYVEWVEKDHILVFRTYEDYVKDIAKARAAANKVSRQMQEQSPENLGGDYSATDVAGDAMDKMYDDLQDTSVEIHTKNQLQSDEARKRKWAKERLESIKKFQELCKDKCSE